MISVVLALSVCVAAYAFLAAYAYYAIQLEHLEVKTLRLSSLTQRQRDLRRKSDLLEQVRLFDDQVTAFKLNRRDWLFYDVNVQGEFNYDAAQEIIQQCGDSELAYYWPLSLEIKTVDKSQPSTGQAVRGDVRLTVKGQFVARR